MAKETYIRLRCTNEFKQQIEALAIYKGLTVSSYIQMILTEKNKRE